MPEFVMEGRDRAARAESAFVLGFIEAMFFTEICHSVTAAQWVEHDADLLDGTLPCDVGYVDIHPDSLAAIRADCEAWQAQHELLLAQAYARDGYSESQAGRDYWFTRNGHGVGFWDRRELASTSDEWAELQRPLDTWSQADSAQHAKLKAESLGELLSAACRYKEVRVWFADHVTHGDVPFVHVEL